MVERLDLLVQDSLRFGSSHRQHGKGEGDEAGR